MKDRICIFDMILRKFHRELEPIGLIFILFAFGWQCYEESLNSLVYESHILNINEKLNAIWAAEYDEAMHTEKYQKDTIFLHIISYESVDKSIFHDWNKTKKDLHVIESQREIGLVCRFIMYILGSLLVILSKIKRAIKD